MNRAESIAALVTDKYSGFKDEDQSLLEAASDARLEEFLRAAEASKSEAAAKTKLEAENRNTSARLKVAEDRLKASEAEMTEEEFIARAPKGIKATLEAIKAEEAELKADLISGLKDCGADTEEELKKKSIPELKTLAKYARIEVQHDYSGKRTPVDRFAQDNASYDPPDPYAAGIKVLQEAATKH